jgi:methylmalonyl-CoA mutase N-terminal domain/subunit
VEDQINEARYRMAEAIESGEQSLVGVNIFREEDEEVKINIFKHAEDMQEKRIQYIKNYKRNRDQEPVQKVLDKLYDLIKRKSELNLIEPIMEAVDAGATLQEICDALRRAADFSIPS